MRLIWISIAYLTKAAKFDEIAALNISVVGKRSGNNIGYIRKRGFPEADYFEKDAQFILA